jgi:hypothetical protein
VPSLVLAVMPRPPRTLIEIGAMNLMAASGDTGVRSQIRSARRAGDAVMVFATLAQAALAGKGESGWPNQREYAEFAGITERQAIRHWELVREVFPGEEGPDRVAKLMAAELGARIQDRGAAVATSAMADRFAIA